MNRMSRAIFLCSVFASWALPSTTAGQESEIEQRAAALLLAFDEVGLGPISDRFRSAKDPLAVGRWGAVIASQSTASTLEGFCGDKHAGLAMLAEWQLVRRQIEGFYLASRGQELQTERSRVADQDLTFNTVVEAVRRKALAGFLKRLRAKLKVEIPEPWAKCVADSRANGHGIMPPFESMMDFWEECEARAERYAITSDGETAVVDVCSGLRPWEVRFPAGVEEHAIVECVDTGRMLYLVSKSHSDDDEFTLHAFKRGARERVWVSDCAEYLDEDAKIGAGGGSVFISASEKSSTVAAFFVLPSSFAVDVYDSRTGQRQWCFGTKLPILLHFAAVQ